MGWSGERSEARGGWFEGTDWGRGMDSGGGGEQWLLGGGVEEVAARGAAASCGVPAEREADGFLGNSGASEAGVGCSD